MASCGDAWRASRRELACGYSRVERRVGGGALGVMRGEGLMRDGHGLESGGGWLPDVMWGMMIWLWGGDGRARLHLSSRAGSLRVRRTGGRLWTQIDGARGLVSQDVFSRFLHPCVRALACWAQLASLRRGEPRTAGPPPVMTCQVGHPIAPHESEAPARVGTLLHLRVSTCVWPRWATSCSRWRRPRRRRPRAHRPPARPPPPPETPLARTGSLFCRP